MWPSIRDAIKNFFTNKDYFAAKWDKWVAKVRATIMASGAMMAFYSDQLCGQFPQWCNGVKATGVVLMGLSLLLRAGDKTPQEIKDLAASMKP